MTLTKINSKGEYQPFYGYTVVSMMKEDIGDAIEKFIKESSLKEFFAPLPSNTYHMTLFNIYVVGSTPIPTVSEWQTRGGFVPNNAWLPDDVLAVENMSAFNCLNAEAEIRLTKSVFKFSKKSLGVSVELDDGEYARVQDIRHKLSTIYRHLDLSLEKRNSLHITFAYGYAPSKKFSKQNMVDLGVLEKIVNKTFQNLVLSAPELYLFNCMDNYVPFKDFCTSIFT